jgi:arylsulfatase A-like enzyme
MPAWIIGMLVMVMLGCQTRRPNVLFLAIDDLNDWTGVLGGHPQTQTPNIDRLSRSGLTFTRAYCNAPACNPSRASMMCSIRPSTSGVYQNNQPWRPALPDAVTLSQYFMANGYRVLGGGKIFHGSYPDPASWHEYFSQVKDPKPNQLPLNGIPQTSHFDWGPLDHSDKDMGDMQLVDWAADVLHQNHQDPFFLAVGIYRPHLPWYVPKKYFDRFPLSEIKLPIVKEDDLADVPPEGKKMAKPGGDHKKVIDTDNWKKAIQGYLASIAFTDACVGRLLDALNASRYAGNTIIVMWSDHGWHLGEKEHWRKFALWEEATRVSMAMVAPGITRPDTQCPRTVSLLDVYPTLVEACGLPTKPDLAGQSLVPLLRDPNAAWDRPVVTTHGRNNHAVRSERYRYIRYQNGEEELYDHDQDPLEWNNLAGKPDLTDLKEQLAAWIPEVNAPDAAPDSDIKKTQRQPKPSK